MDSQYYIPGIADFYIGCEYEYKEKTSDVWLTGGSDPANLSHVYTTWREYKYDYRIPYLTIEQIESELGFDHGKTPEGTIYKIRHLDQNYTLLYDFTKKTILIYKDLKFVKSYKRDGIVYNSTCRCINDFRLICKLLNIK
jgi:hypothetical protein